jgi:uncharacterized protein (UPF0297 family)
MALRPEIALQTQGIKLPDFAGAYESVLNNRARRENLHQNRQLYQAQMQEYQRKTAAAQAQAERDSATRAKLAGGAKAQDIMGDDPELAMKLAGEERSQAEAEMKARLSGLDEEKKTLDIQLEKAKRFGSLAGSVTDENTLAIAIGQAMREGLPDEVGLKMLKQGYTPETQAALKAFQEQALTTDQQLTQRRQQIELEMKQAAEKREVEKQPLVIAKLGNEVEAGKVDPQTGLTRKDAKELDFKAQTQQAVETYRANSLKISQQNANRIAASQGRSATQNQVTNEAKLRDDFSAAAKPFKAVSEAFTRVMAADGDKGVNDIALIYGYMKMLDPGSVVREGEFATAANAAGIPDRITTLYNNAINGAKLSPQIRQEMKEQARQVYKAAEEDFAGVEGEYKAIAERSGVDSRNVIVNFRSKKGADATQDDGTSVKLPNGRVMKFPSKAAAEAFKKDAKL